ncbi:MAG TPA: PKD domain-containing protein [Phycisphaerales bacterium]|nr:PKD domain-containing protein [Phycisphaerales bacterium]
MMRHRLIVAALSAWCAVVSTSFGAVLTNGNFSAGLSGWQVDGNCTFETAAMTDDAIHGGVAGVALGGYGGCSPVELSQTAIVDTTVLSSFRVRADVKLMRYYFYTGAVRLRITTGPSSPYDQTVIGEHVFTAGAAPSISYTLSGASTLPVGSWCSWTSDDILGMLPSGVSTPVRVSMVVLGPTGYGWSRFDNVDFILDDPDAPVPTANGAPLTGNPPLLVNFTSSATDSGSIGAIWWDLGNGNDDWQAVGGGTTSTSGSPSQTYINGGTRTYFASFAAEDNSGAARSTYVQVVATNPAPVVDIVAVPDQGAAPLNVAFSTNATDNGTIVSYLWNFGDGGTSGAVSPSHVYSNPGTYNCTLTCTDDQGDSTTASYLIIASGPDPLWNGDFASGLSGWVMEDNCSESQLRPDDAVHGQCFGVYRGGGGGCTAATLSQVGLVDVDSQSSVRLRVDIKEMLYYFYTGPVYLDVYAGVAPNYDQVLLGTHSFNVGPVSETFTMSGATTLPLGTWYSWTSDDLKPLCPAGTMALKVRWRVPGIGQYGWARVDNIRFVLNDPNRPNQPGIQANPTSGQTAQTVLYQAFPVPSDPDGPIVAEWWDFGNGLTDWISSIGGSTSTFPATFFRYVFARNPFWVSYTVEDQQGAARTTFQAIPIAFNCSGDVNGDGVVTLADIARILAAWGQTVAPGTLGDLDGDGVVGIADIALVITWWGANCP